jgi:murein L,D-transpeptidase YcbB/YkuD
MGSMLKSEPDVIVPLDAQQTHTGDRSEASLALSQRLRQLGFLPVSSSPESDQILGPTIGSALLRFQQLRGLTPTGTVDSATLKALNVPLQRRAEQLSMTLERWRWLPHDFVEPPIVINIPEFRLRAYDRDGNVQFSMAVIVGRAGNRKTPILSATMNEVIFHPYWNVPPSIQAHEIGPILSRNPSYLSQHGFEVIDRSGRVLDNTSIGARQKVIHGEARIRQVPGAQNALGYMKFSFPNAFNIYMHGTPQVSLFTKTKRDFSHGCIRVEDPEHLAQWVLRGQPPWTVEKIAAAIANPATSTLHLAQPVPVLIVYGTGIAAEDDTVRFFEDIYGYDAELRAQLDQISASRTQEDRLPWSALNKK